MSTQNITPRMIALSKETASLLDCKKMVDECFAKINEVRQEFFCQSEDFDKKLSSSYFAANRIIMEMLSDQIDQQSSESKYEMI